MAGCERSDEACRRRIGAGGRRRRGEPAYRRLDRNPGRYDERVYESPDGRWRIIRSPSRNAPPDGPRWTILERVDGTWERRGPVLTTRRHCEAWIETHLAD